MKVLVLGANGFIGSRLVDRLLEEGHQVRILTRTQGKVSNKNTEAFVGDLKDQNLDFVALLDGCEVIFNCAGEIRNENLMHELHVASTQRFLKAITEQTSSQTVHWVQLSSVGAYGSVPNVERIVTEETEVNPKGQYEVTKTLADQCIVSMPKNGQFTFSILRPSNVFGPGMPNNSIRQLIGIVRRRLFFYVGFKDSISTYIHVDDVVSALMLCGFDGRAKGEIFNISNDCPLRDVIAGIAVGVAVSPPKVVLPESLVRLGVSVASVLTKGLITQERVNALTARTRYPFKKIETVLGFVPRKHVPENICDI
ncbi:NAD-dependent epimerase/dehydratase family protein [Pseudomonas sp. YuFO8]|jgi:nucleoside-diphosphate-sugar epimerase|uniref:NAD-dependent epimerase/dehydratase family protein n=1 Tax=Pseudomonas sp. YuFO8 TaxID=3095361 RepID=UPI002B24721E|nr:NAD-dependent epimerase/dehydratase family protein [Pseudomonas sp. YuFO8]MEB2625107.1 NAD-dependent epimerase/dehydratase family protein [Pseudomonas sp. YuFO8]